MAGKDEKASEDKEASSKKSLKRFAVRLSFPVLLGLVNFVVAIGAGGLLFYTRFVYKRPAITEESERQKLADLHTKPPAANAPGMATFEPITVNITANPPSPKPADGTTSQIAGKLHYVTIGFSLELREESRK